MALERAQQHLAQWGLDQHIMEFDVSSATVDKAAQALNCEPARIAKTLSFQNGGEGCLLLVTAGDTRIDNPKFRAAFGNKPRMLDAEDVERLTGHAIGGVCPFGVEKGARVYLDISLRRFATVYPACGSSNSAIELTPEQLEQTSASLGWVDVCKNWN